MNDHTDRIYKDVDGSPVSLDTLCRKEPAWAANRLRVLEGKLDNAEQALHEAHERASLREGVVSDMSRRLDGTQRRLARIRTKADLATGITSEDDRDARDLAGRAVGAEGAVDLLIARLAWAVSRALKE